MKAAFFYLLLLFALLFAQVSLSSARADSIPASLRNSTVELHAHLFMKEGMTWAFRGGFFGPLRAKSWRDRFSSQANPRALEKSNLAIVVASLYAHPLFTLSLRDSIRRQIALARKFVLSRPDWVIATDPMQAQEALDSGKHVMILELEGASGILENDRDIREFIDKGGIRIVGPLHLIDDEFGGVAFLHGWRVLSNPWAWIEQFFSSHYSEGARLNPNGLTNKGRWLVKTLLRHHVWIDLAHASDRSMQQIIKILTAAHQPLLYSHTVLRKYHHAERGVSETMLHEIAATGGIVGLMPSEEMLAGAPTSRICPSALYALAREYQDVAEVVGSDAVMMGSDYNGGIPHLRPGCKTGTSLDKQGLWNMGQIPDLWKALKVLGAPVPKPLSRMTEKFLEDWKKAYNSDQFSAMDEFTRKGTERFIALEAAPASSMH